MSCMPKHQPLPKLRKGHKIHFEKQDILPDAEAWCGRWVDNRAVEPVIEDVTCRQCLKVVAKIPLGLFVRTKGSSDILRDVALVARKMLGR